MWPKSLSGLGRSDLDAIKAMGLSKIESHGMTRLGLWSYLTRIINP